MFTVIASTKRKDNGTTPAIDTTGAHLIVIALAFATGSTVSDSEGNTWTPLTSVGGSVRSRMYYCLAPTTSATHTFTVAASDFPAMMVAAFASGTGTAALDQDAAGGTSNSATSIQPGSLTPPADDALFVTGFATAELGDVESAMIDSGFTKLVNQAGASGANFQGALGYLIQGTAAAKNPTWSIAGGATFVSATMATFLESGGGGGGGGEVSHPFSSWMIGS